MKKKFFTAIIACFVSTGLWAQEADARFDEAKTAYKSGNMQDARFALQQALHEIDKAIGKEILSLLPTSMNTMPATTSGDEITSTNLGFAGVYVVRAYQNEEGQRSNIQIISDSPLLAGINAILSLPMIGGGDPNQKRIKVGNYRGLLQRSASETGIVSWDVQIPFGSSLLTFHCEGIQEEKLVMDMANTIPVDRIAKLIQ